MIRIATFTTAAALVGSTLALGQSIPARPPATAPARRYVVIGCVARQGTVAAPHYVITDTRGESRTTYRLQGDSAQLAQHAGHTVEVAGPLTAPAAGSTQYTLKVDSLAWIASNCKR
jgi:hypothetical protein